MQDDELKLEETEASHTLGGAGEVARGEGRGEGVDATPLSCTLTEIHQSRGGGQNMPGCVAITDAPVCMSERGAGGRGGCGHTSAISVVIHTCGITTVRSRTRNTVCQNRQV